ncbi:MAG: acetate--CoA ligase family protein [Anaerolineaceae bacterium]|nr:acetate--CoA ligase family protein [Anaerolineaceae bacterium]HOV30824.1 acetate--CoA ligase family protein [Anaerolineaceae bacterium]
MDPILTGLLKPKSIAIIGASTNPTKIGYKVVLNLIESQYKGGIYPVNPSATEILGLKCYPTVNDIPYVVDAAVITVPAKGVLEVTKQCGEKGVKGLIIITSGFGEVGEVELEREIVRVARSYGMRVLGPNIVGTLSNSDHMNASFAPFLPLPGKASLVSQSGALLIAMDAATYTRRVGFDKMISIGNMSDVDFSELIRYLAEDPDTSCITLYVEGLHDGREFINAARACKKPIIMLKAGVSEHGAAAAASHTGSLAGAAKVYSAAMEQAGITQATDLNDLFDSTLALSLQPTMKGENLLILTNGGGVGVLATDAAEKYGLPLKFAPAEVQEEMKKHMPDFGSAKNPVDMTGMAGNDWYYETTKSAFAHPWVDGLVVLYCQTAITNPAEIAEAIHRGIKDAGVTDKPVTISFVGGEECDKAMEWLVEQGLPAYNAPDLAVKSIINLRKQQQISEINNNGSYTPGKIDREKARAIIAAARKNGRDVLTEIEAKQVFKCYGLPVTAIDMATSEEEAVEFAEKIGFPIVMKIVSADILHKSDAGGVKVNIKNTEQVREAYRTILENARNYKPDALIEGVAVQEMAPWATEVIIGSINDKTFGPTVMFGLGGIFVEVLKDVVFRVAPISVEEALRMQDEIRSAAILNGTRGELPRDKAALAEVLAAYAYMVDDLKDEVAESDANPVIMYEAGKGVKVVDARIILTKK